MSLLFGLPMPGGMNYSPILVANAAGPAWVSGGAQGPEASAFGVIIAMALLIVMARATSDLQYKYAFDEVVPGGIPVDIDAAARQQHEAAMGATQPAEPQLVQILPAQGSTTVGPSPAIASAEGASDGAEEASRHPDAPSDREAPGPEAD